MNTLYRSKIGEVRDYEGWKVWAENFYSSLGYDDHGRDIDCVKRIHILMPSNWFNRITKVLKLEVVE